MEREGKREEKRAKGGRKRRKVGERGKEAEREQEMK